MRLEVTIPDQLFANAQRAAEKTGLSMEAFLNGALEDRVEASHEDSSPLVLSPEQIASVLAADEQIRKTGGLTMAEVEKNLAAKKAQWLKSRQAS